MGKLNELSEEGFKNLLDEYFAAPEKRHKLTEEEIRQVAAHLNKKINVPIINETREEKILIKIVMKIDTFLYDHLPNEFYDLVRSIDKGIDDKEAKRLIKRLSKLANEKIDIPYVPEFMEYYAIRFVIAIIVNAARKDKNMDLSQVEIDKAPIPKRARATDRELEKMLE